MADRARSSIVIDATPDAVMAVIADFVAYPTWSPQVKQVEVLATDDEGRGTEARFVLDAGVVKDEYTLAYDWSTPGSLSWHLTAGQMQKRQEGSYVLQGTGTGTEVVYDLTVELAIPMLGLFKRKAEKLIIDTALRGLKRRVEAG
jgi:ribosome-associated toxin RatA of RatAB toxin-antitoxin module